MRILTSQASRRKNKAGTRCCPVLHRPRSYRLLGGRTVEAEKREDGGSGTAPKEDNGLGELTICWHRQRGAVAQLCEKERGLSGGRWFGPTVSGIKEDGSIEHSQTGPGPGAEAVRFPLVL